MYSGTTLTPVSGRIMGAHQKFDRVARNQLSKILPNDKVFPSSRKILHFEGRKGPDAIKRKSPARDEPWHYYSPFDNNDSQLIELIQSHYSQLVKELKNDNKERVAFESAWLAHAIVDGLTPAHHYPYEEELSKIRGSGKETRTTVREKLLPKGETKRDTLKKSWKVYGPKGLMSTHGLFELGVAFIIAPLSMSNATITEQDINNAQVLGVVELFRRTAREIAVLDMFERFKDRGWTTKLMMDVRNKLAPSISKMITMSWYLALVDAKLIEPRDII
ncbi:MAG: hypothetical protein H6793_03840 [Candidatus Nomurabacteria bacterium]|nr:hypothetical protein [Candidatus Saccharibacteria bacterium]USN95431.1 MAG: hypothetical protein H6793_03840 [Candidatus Nomurabacteria bacterium]